MRIRHFLEEENGRKGIERDGNDGREDRYRGKQRRENGKKQVVLLVGKEELEYRGREVRQNRRLQHGGGQWLENLFWKIVRGFHSSLVSKLC